MFRKEKMLNKIKGSIAIWNVGVCFIGLFISFVFLQSIFYVLQLCDSLSSLYKAVGVANKCAEGISGYMILFIAMMVVAVVAIVAGIMHARRVASDGNQKTLVGYISTIAMIVLHGYLTVSFIITLIAKNSDKLSAVSNSSASSTISLSSIAIGSIFFTDWGICIALILALINLGLAIAGLVFVITYKPAKAGIETMHEVGTISTGASVVEQYAKPEKKEEDLPPMLNGEASADVFANPSISGLRTIMPTEGANTTTATMQQPEPVAAEPVQPAADPVVAEEPVQPAAEQPQPFAAEPVQQPDQSIYPDAGQTPVL